MQSISTSQLLDSLNWRYAVKKFDANKKIPADTWKALEKALTLSPSSYGLQPWRFVIVDNPQTRAALRAHSWNQGQITDASQLVVFCRKLAVTPEDVQAYIDDTAKTRGIPAAALDGYKGMMLGSISNPQTLGGGTGMDSWTARQCYIALGVFMTSCAVLGVDACPMEGFDPAKYDEILGLRAQGYTATVIATAGYRASDDPTASMKKVRFSVEQIVKHV